MPVMEKFAAFIGSLSPQEQGEVMPLMINFMQGNLGTGMSGAASGEPLLPPPAAGPDAGGPPGAAPPSLPPGAAPGPAPAPEMPGLQPGGLTGRPPMPPTQIGNKAY